MERSSNTTHSRVKNKYLSIYLEKSIIEVLQHDGLSNINSKKNSQVIFTAKEEDHFTAKINDNKHTLYHAKDLVTDIIESSKTPKVDIPKIFEFKKKDHLRSLLKDMTNIESLSGFSTSQVLIHEKGTTNIYSLSFKNNEYIESFEDTAFFNTLFTKVRKSKNKSFDQKELLNKHINLNGHFLAKEISLRDFNLILLLSRDDLFPISENDRVDFNNFVIKLIPKLFNIISYESNKLIEIEKSNIIKNFPLASVKFSEDGNRISLENLESAQQDTSSLHHERILLMGELLNTLRHELSNPLFGIDLSHNLLMDQIDDFEVKDTLSHISNSVKRSQAIIQEFSNLYQDNDSLSLISLKNLISETITLTKSESRAHKVIFNMDNDIEVKSNGTLLSQVIFNLLINSSQALTNDQIDNGVISIDVEVTEDNVNINIQDNGNGIPNEIKDNIFNPFFTTKETGTGLGLAICKNLLKKINGEISLIDVNEGTLFRVQVPRT